MNNQARQALLSLSGQQLTRKLLQGMLADRSPGCKAERAALLAALDSGVADELARGSTTGDPAIKLARLAQRLEQDGALTADAARWAVDSLALFHGLVKDSELLGGQRGIDERERLRRQEEQRRPDEQREREKQQRQSGNAQSEVSSPPPVSLLEMLGARVGRSLGLANARVVDWLGANRGRADLRCLAVGAALGVSVGGLSDFMVPFLLTVVFVGGCSFGAGVCREAGNRIGGILLGVLYGVCSVLIGGTAVVWVASSFMESFGRAVCALAGGITGAALGYLWGRSRAGVLRRCRSTMPAGGM